MYDLFIMGFVFVLYYAVLEVGDYVLEVHPSSSNTHLSRDESDDFDKLN